MKRFCQLWFCYSLINLTIDTFEDLGRFKMVHQPKMSKKTAAATEISLMSAFFPIKTPIFFKTEYMYV